MDFINLAHGVQYMLGAYLAVTFTALTGNLFLALPLALLAALAIGLLLEVAVFRHLYDRDHLEQVLATFGIILFLNQGVKIVWARPRSRFRSLICCRARSRSRRACSIRSIVSPSSPPAWPWRWGSTLSSTTRGSAC